MPATTHSTAPAYATALRYTDRATKALYVADKYCSILKSTVLDVGCDRKQLSLHLPQSAVYTGVDLNDAADIVINLDRQDLPFEDGRFETVVCTDVLEHLERLHAVFDELCRVSKGHVIVSLPNPVRTFALAALEGSQGRLKYYGLPVDAPVDRHRWFFGYEEAVAFIRGRAERNGWRVQQIDVSEHGLPPILDEGGRAILNGPNAVMGTIWGVLERPARV